MIRCNSYAHQIREAYLFEYKITNYLEHFKKFDYMYWIAMSGANYKVASFKRSYNGNQKRRFVRATGLEAQSFTVLNISNVLTRLKNYRKSKVSAKFRFGTF